jgi:hypothetical protein
MYDEIQRVREKTGVGNKTHSRLGQQGDLASHARGYGEELKNLSEISDDF